MNRRNKFKTHTSFTGTFVTKSMRNKAIFAGAMFCLVMFGAVTFNLVRYQFLEAETYQMKAQSQQLSDEIITPHRGSIYDTNMKEFARSSTVWTVVVSPAALEQIGADPVMVASKLSEILGLEVTEVLEKLNDKESHYKVIERKVEKPQTDLITEWMNELKGRDEDAINLSSAIYTEPDSKRYYPYGSLASTVIGFTNSDGDGLTGLELYYNDELAGTPGRILSAENAMGFEMDSDYRTVYAAEDGNSLVLTLDRVIQQTLEKYLSNAIVDHNVANRGTGIIMNVQTGEILAMATLPGYDLNNPYELYDDTLVAEINAIVDEQQRSTALQTAQQTMWRNKAVQDIYEPGSVFKVVTASAAYDSGSVEMDTTYSCSGSIQVASHTMRCAHLAGHGTLDFYGGLNKSCNPYFIQMTWEMGREIFCDYLEVFGFYEKTGIDMQNEAQSNVYTVEIMNITERSSSSFGQSSQVTPIAMLNAVAAAVNGGYLMEPYTVKQIIDSNGNILEVTEPYIKRQVISEETSQTIAAMLEDSVSSGSNKAAYVQGYRVGGKSGTSQKQTVVEGNEDDSLRISSFVGFAPADDPLVACIIILDEPHDEFSSYGGVLCAPVVGAILSDVLPYMGVEPQYTQEELLTVDEIVPDITGMTVIDANRQLNAKGFNAKEVGVGTVVTHQFPAAGTSVARQSVVVLYTEEGTQSVSVVVPDLTNKTVSQAKALLSAAGLNISVMGVGEESENVKAMSQSFTPGTEVTMGTVVEVIFHDVTITD